MNKMTTFFNESLYENFFFPRALWVDLEPSTVNKIQGGPIGRLINPDLAITGNISAGNNWAVGYYTEGAYLMDQVLEKFRH